MVLACSVRSPELSYPDSIGALEPPDPEVWEAMVASDRWRRPASGQLDRLVPTAVTTWLRAAEAAAAALGEDPEMAALAIHLLAVPTDLVLWVLTTVPVGHQHLRQVLLRELPPRLGSALARRADLPTVFRELMEPEAHSRLGLCLDIGRQTLTSAQLWPATAPTDEAELRRIVAKRARTRATKAAWRAAASTDR
jgi:hypothetical protein